MTRFRFAALLLGLAAIVAVSGVQAQDKKDDRKTDRPAGGGFGGFGRLGGMSGPLVPDSVQDKLSLTADQKEKVAKLQKEFDEKSKETTEKVRKEIQEAIQNQDFQSLGGLTQKMQEVQKIRTDYEGKVKALLTDDQKKTYETALKDRPMGGLGGFGGFGGGGGFGGAGGGGFGGFGGARTQTPKELTSADVQDKLNLTKEQKDKIAKLKKEFEEQTQNVLTDEQKKKFEEIKKEQPETPRRPGGRGGNRTPPSEGK
jgi:Spy/CpxP family protein refolding chaperone